MKRYIRSSNYTTDVSSVSNYLDRRQWKEIQETVLPFNYDVVERVQHCIEDTFNVFEFSSVDKTGSYNNIRQLPHNNGASIITTLKLDLTSDHKGTLIRRLKSDASGLFCSIFKLQEKQDSDDLYLTLIMYHPIFEMRLQTIEKPISIDSYVYDEIISSIPEMYNSLNINEVCDYYIKWMSNFL